jgi:hypothetical protein
LTIEAKNNILEDQFIIVALWELNLFLSYPLHKEQEASGGLKPLNINNL